MKKTEKPMYLNLQLFGEGAGASGTGTGTGDGGTGASGTKGETATAAVSQQGVTEVKYGVQTEENGNAQAPDVQQSNSNKEDRPDFEELIKGEYKESFDAKVQKIIKERLKNSTEIVSKFEALAPTLELLSKKYGVDSNDIDALNGAIESDDSYWEDEAMQRGISVDQLKEMRKMQRENTELKRQMQEKNMREKAAQDVSRWIQESEPLKNTYPNFNLKAEMENPQFISMLKSGVGVKAAYEALHINEIIPFAMQTTAKSVEEKVVNNIMANGTRPVENGNASQGPSMTKSDVSQLTKADREEIAKRVARGEKISFG